MSQSERSFIMIKPDGVQRNLVGEVIKRFEQKGFKLVGLKLTSVSKELAEEHYGDLSSKPFFPSLVSFIVSSPVVAMVWEGAFRTLFYRRLLPASSLLERAIWRSHASPISSGVNLSRHSRHHSRSSASLTKGCSSYWVGAAFTDECIVLVGDTISVEGRQKPACWSPRICDGKLIHESAPCAWRAGHSCLVVAQVVLASPLADLILGCIEPSVAIVVYCIMLCDGSGT